MAKKKQELTVQGEMRIDEVELFQRISEIIENRKARAGAYANREIALMYWEVGIHINSVVLDGGRAAYGKNILSTPSTKLSWSHFCEIICYTENRWGIAKMNELKYKLPTIRCSKCYS